MLFKKPPELQNPRFDTRTRQPHSIGDTEYLMFLDIEPEDIIGCLPHRQMFIPNIREIAFIIIPTSDFLATPTTTDLLKINIYEYKQLNTHRTYIELFNKLYAEYKKPLIISHNGYAFDFIILKAYETRYLNANPTLKFFDSYRYVRATKIRAQNFKNITLYVQYNEYYVKHQQLQPHTAKDDATITMLWLRALWWLQQTSH